METVAPLAVLKLVLVFSAKSLSGPASLTFRSVIQSPRSMNRSRTSSASSPACLAA